MLRAASCAFDANRTLGPWPGGDPNGIYPFDSSKSACHVAGGCWLEGGVLTACLFDGVARHRPSALDPVYDYTVSAFNRAVEAKTGIDPGIPTTPRSPIPTSSSSVVQAFQAARLGAGKQDVTIGGRLPKYPSTAVKRWNTTRKVWSIYAPGTRPTIGVAGLDGACLFGSCGLGAETAQVTPEPPGAKIGEEPVNSPDAARVRTGEEEHDGPPWHKNWKTYAVLGGVLALGAGAWYVLK